jgi:hypothetical protein
MNKLAGRRNRGLTRVLSFKITEDMHDALLEYITMQEKLEWRETYYHKGMQYGKYGMADYLRNIVGKFLQDKLEREILIYEYENTNA